MKEILKNKKILLGSAVALLLSYYLYKKLKENKKALNIEVDTTGLSKSDIDYNSANGNSGEGINIKKYLDFMRSTPSTDIDTNNILVGKNIYTLFDKVNLRNDANLSNYTKIGVIPKQYTYLGKVDAIALDDKGDIFFSIVPNNSNFKIANLFHWGKGKVNPFRRYVRWNAVFCKVD